jgi:hypothetical protein
VNLPVPVDAFGGAIGHALGTLGSAVEGASDKLWARAVDLQNLQNETNAKNADAEYMQQSGLLHAAFINKEGVNAGPDALAAHIKELQDLRKNIRDGLASPMAQKMYDASSLSFMGRNIFNAAGHSGQQMKVAANAADNSRIDELSDSAGANPTDDEMFQRNTYAIHDTVAQMGHRMGWSDEQIDEASKQQISAAVAKRAAGLARTGRLDEAQHLVDNASKQGVLLPKDEDHVGAIVQTQRRAVGSANIATEVYNGGLDDSGNQTKSLKALQDEARAKATAQYPNDPIYAQHAVAAMDSQWYVNKRAEVDQRNGNRETVNGAIMGGAQNLQQVLADPKTAAAYYALPKAEQLAVPGRINNYNRQRDEFANQRALTTVLGMRTSDPVAFLDLDPTDPKVGLNQQQMRTVMGWQASDRKQSQADPRVHRAISILQPDMNAAGIAKKGGADTPETQGYYQFVGALQDQLDAYHHANPNKTPPPEEVRKMGAQLMQFIITGKTWYGGDYKEPVYNQEVPEKEAAAIKNDPYWDAHGITPNDGMIKRIYVAQQFKKLYGGTAKSTNPDATQFPPNAPVSQ